MVQIYVYISINAADRTNYHENLQSSMRYTLVRVLKDKSKASNKNNS